MNKEARLISLFFAVVIAGLTGCAHKPSYSEMDVNKASRNQNQNAGGQTAEQTPPAAEQPAAEAAPPAPAPPPAAFTSPRFLDQAQDRIKDLPAYPNSRRVSAQVGPIQGVNTMSMAYLSTDEMDKITAFFERVLKDNKWTVSDKIIDPEFSEWNLKKGENDSAKVQVKRDPQTRALVIVIVRGETLVVPSK